jgi:hypothetical protein
MNITLNFFPIKEAEKIDKLNSDEIREEDEDYTFEHHISLKNVKKEIECYLFKPPKNSIATQENLFLFIYKIFHLLKYYNKLEKYFQINSNFLKALIGNKVDLKFFLKEEQIDDFIKSNNFKYYEIICILILNYFLKIYLRIY